jgi:hypothetical protein
MVCNRLGSQSGYELKWINGLIDALPEANHDDYVLICRCLPRHRWVAYWSCLFGVKIGDDTTINSMGDVDCTFLDMHSVRGACVRSTMKLQEQIGMHLDIFAINIQINWQLQITEPINNMYGRQEFFLTHY